MSPSSSTAAVRASATRIVPQDAGDAQARAWYGRYRRLFIGDAIVSATMDLCAHRDDPCKHAAFARLREGWSRHGGYIETVSLDHVRSWPGSGEHIIAEAAPFRPDGRFEVAADCVYHLPSDDWVMRELSKEPIEIYDRTLYDTIIEDGPQATALIDFLGVLPEWPQRELAGDARWAGMRELRRRNVALPPELRIRHVVGMTFAVQGVEPLDPAERASFGPLVHLADLGQEEIVNRASMRAISLSRRCPARPLGCWTHMPPVPVSVDGRPYRLHVHWYVRVRNVDLATVDPSSEPSDPEFACLPT